MSRPAGKMAAAAVEVLTAPARDPLLTEAAEALRDKRPAAAERLLRAFLRGRPTDVAALRMLAEVAAGLGRHEDAATLLSNCLAVVPGCDAARYDYAIALHRQNKPIEALAQAELLLARDPADPSYGLLRAACLAQLGDHEGAIAAHENVLGAHPEHPQTWLGLGHALKTVGRLAEAIAAYRRSVELSPTLGEAYWSLANLKTFRFDAREVAAMRDALARDDLTDDDRVHLDFALGKALEDAGSYAAAFGHYRAANARRRRTLGYDGERVADHVARSMALFTPDFFARRAGWGASAEGPIFIVGLPRAGSTLIEQILASHSRVEGAGELPDILALARQLGRGGGRGEAIAYPENLGQLDAADFRTMGEAYLETTRVRRRLERPFFIDKMPNNFAHVGLIHLILPRARIIDARRDARAGCFACFKQHFSRGQAFTNNLTDLGRYWTNYTALMAHFDAVLPGGVHRIMHEDMVAAPEREIRRLLDHCDLDFEPACLNFHATRRAVRTPSSEQVRQPIFTEGLDQWRRFEPWLGPLKTALAEPRRATSP